MYFFGILAIRKECTFLEYWLQGRNVLFWSIGYKEGMYVFGIYAIRKECTFFWNIGYKEGMYFFGI